MWWCLFFPYGYQSNPVNNVIYPFHDGDKRSLCKIPQLDQQAVLGP